jgi:hypothetical protein
MYLVNERSAMPSLSNQELTISVRGVVRCVKCDEVVDVGEIGRVPRQFAFMCPNCAHRGAYPRGDVRIEVLAERADEGMSSGARFSARVARVGLVRKALDHLHDLSLRRRVRLDVALGGAQG